MVNVIEKDWLGFAKCRASETSEGKGVEYEESQIIISDPVMRVRHECQKQ